MLGPDQVPFAVIGGEAKVRALVERFYDAMDRDEPALAALHALDEQGRVDRQTRDRFGLFLIGWLGGPQDYMAKHGHPRLRMRHNHVAIDVKMRDAWLRAMTTAMDQEAVAGDLRRHLDQRFAEVADFLRNRDEG
jgi:hemoglobin